MVLYPLLQTSLRSTSTPFPSVQDPFLSAMGRLPDRLSGLSPNSQKRVESLYSMIASLCAIWSFFSFIRHTLSNLAHASSLNQLSPSSAAFLFFHDVKAAPLKKNLYVYFMQYSNPAIPKKFFFIWILNLSTPIFPCSFFYFV